MNARRAGVTLALVHLLLVSAVALKYAADRARLPSAWARTVPFDPSLPIRGRYVRLRLQVPMSDTGTTTGALSRVRLVAAAGRVYAVADSATGLEATIDTTASAPAARLVEPIAFFIPEHVPDPSARPGDEELWAEVTLPASGPPRPIRLGVRRGGAIEPLDLR
ncbi:MAG TPA: hypothetical protein VFJ92_10940 [Gemmatimonadales bacterium]|nr:hypothetical protein [Gemmatimonadales bacterium]